MMHNIFKLAKVCDSDEKFAEFEHEISKIDNVDIYYKGHTLLMYICYYNHTEFAPKIIKLLIKLGADVNIREKHLEFNALMYSLVFNTNESVVKITELLIGANINVNSQNKNGYTTLMCALMDNYYRNKYCDYTCNVIEKLLKAGANPNCGRSSLFKFCDNNEIICLLIKNNAKPTFADIQNNTQLYTILGIIKDEKIAELEKKNAELEEKNAELLSIMDYIPSGNGYENCAEDYNKNLNLQHYEIANE